MPGPQGGTNRAGGGWLTVKQVAGMTGRSAASLNCARGLNRPELNSPLWRKVGGRYYYHVSDVQEWMDILGLHPGKR